MGGGDYAKVLTGKIKIYEPLKRGGFVCIHAWFGLREKKLHFNFCLISYQDMFQANFNYHVTFEGSGLVWFSFLCLCKMMPFGQMDV